MAHTVHQQQMLGHHHLMSAFSQTLMPRCQGGSFDVANVTDGQELLHDGTSHLRASVRPHDLRDLLRPHHACYQCTREVPTLQRAERLQHRHLQPRAVVREHVLLPSVCFGERALHIHYHVHPRQDLEHTIICEHAPHWRLDGVGPVLHARLALRTPIRAVRGQRPPIAHTAQHLKRLCSSSVRIHERLVRLRPRPLPPGERGRLKRNIAARQHGHPQRRHCQDNSELQDAVHWRQTVLLCLERSQRANSLGLSGPPLSGRLRIELRHLLHDDGLERRIAALSLSKRRAQTLRCKVAHAPEWDRRRATAGGIFHPELATFGAEALPEISNKFLTEERLNVAHEVWVGERQRVSNTRNTAGFICVGCCDEDVAAAHVCACCVSRAHAFLVDGCRALRRRQRFTVALQHTPLLHELGLLWLRRILDRKSVEVRLHDSRIQQASSCRVRVPLERVLEPMRDSVLICWALI